MCVCVHGGGGRGERAGRRPAGLRADGGRGQRALQVEGVASGLEDCRHGGTRYSSSTAAERKTSEPRAARRRQRSAVAPALRASTLREARVAARDEVEHPLDIVRELDVHRGEIVCTFGAMARSPNAIVRCTTSLALVAQTMRPTAPSSAPWAADEVAERARRYDKVGRSAFGAHCRYARNMGPAP